jgi:inner membrane protein
MSTVGHLFVGAAAGGTADPATPRRTWLLFTAVLMAIAVVPDLDLHVFPALDIPYPLTWGHRGATHSLVFAVGVAAIVGILFGWLGFSRWHAGLAAFAAIGSHAVLDSLSGGPGVYWLWPFVEVRFPTIDLLPMAPVSDDLLTLRGLAALVAEIVVFLPFLLYAVLARRRAARSTERGADVDMPEAAA